jgi:hypothetical protein
MAMTDQEILEGLGEIIDQLKDLKTVQDVVDYVRRSAVSA